MGDLPLMLSTFMVPTLKWYPHDVFKDMDAKIFRMISIFLGGVI